jgi:hypothetical protein
MIQIHADPDPQHCQGVAAWIILHLSICQHPLKNVLQTYVAGFLWLSTNVVSSAIFRIGIRDRGSGRNIPSRNTARIHKIYRNLRSILGMYRYKLLFLSNQFFFFGLARECDGPLHDMQTSHQND